MEGVLCQALGPGGPDLCHAPRAFDAVDVDRAAREFILRAVDRDVAVAGVDEAVPAAPAI